MMQHLTLGQKQSANSLIKTENNSSATCNPVAADGHKETQNAPNSGNNDLSIQKNKSKDEQVDDCILSDVLNKRNEIEILSLDNMNKSNKNLTGMI